MSQYKWVKCDGCLTPVLGRYIEVFYFTVLTENYSGNNCTVSLCPNCALTLRKNNLFEPCKECGRYPAPPAKLSPGGFCPYCHKNFKDYNGLRNYGANVLNLLEKPLNEKKLLLGVELEIEAATDNNQKSQEFIDLIGNDFAIAKEDGSVRGFEIVTLPATLEEHAKKWQFLKNRQELPKGLKGWSGTTNGMHIHISKDILPVSMLPKYRFFVHHEANRQFIYNIAGRRSDTWANVTYFPTLHGKKIDGPNRFIHPKNAYDKSKKESIISLGTGKYSAVNQHRSGKTFEFRIFRSTLNYDRIMTDLEFVHALTNYLLQVPLVGLHHYMWPEFYNWVQKSEYKKLKAFLGKEKHIGVNYQTRDGSSMSGPAVDTDYDDRESVVHTTQDIYNCGQPECRVCNPIPLPFVTNDERDNTICV